MASQLISALLYVWKWSVPYRSGHSPEDAVYATVWSAAVDEEAILHILSDTFQDIPRSQLALATDEEAIRHLVRHHLALREAYTSGASSTSSKEGLDSYNVSPEETWPHTPAKLQYLLASLNAHNLEARLQSLMAASSARNSRAGLHVLKQADAGIRKTFCLWRHGYTKTISRREKYLLLVFFVFLAVSACYPDIAAGFLHERSYNQRSVGMRIVTLWQLYFLWTFPYHTLRLLYHWSLERLLGAFVGSFVYTLAAIVPAVYTVYKEDWFHVMMLVLSLSWQLSVQFLGAARDLVMRLVIRRQMHTLRQLTDPEGATSFTWAEFDSFINHELTPLSTFSVLRSEPIPSAQVPLRVRVERFIQFTAMFKLGRPADQLVGLLKEDFERVINTLQDYQSTVLQRKEMLEKTREPKDIIADHAGHAEPRLPKLLLVVFDVAIFAYASYSFRLQPFTFNTVVAYGAVVTIKQAIMASKRYQTVKAAKRLFTNMAAVNILGMLLVSLPVIINPRVLDGTGAFIGLTLAMTFASIFLAEPIAPALLAATDMLLRCVSFVGILARDCSARWELHEGTAH